MEQEKHLTEQGQQKIFTRSTARHLRRKRLKDARRAEKQLLESINNRNDNNKKEINIARDNNKIDKLQSLIVGSEDICNLSLGLLDLSKSKTQTQYTNCKNISEVKETSDPKEDTQNYNCQKGINTQIDETRLKIIDNNSKGCSSNLSHSCEFFNGPKHGAREIISQTRNNEEEIHTKSIINTPLEQNLSNVLYSVPKKDINCSYNFNHPNSALLNKSDLDLVENQRNLQLHGFSDIDSNNSIQTSIEVKTNTKDSVLYQTSPNNKKSDITEKNNIESDSNTNFTTILAQQNDRISKISSQRLAPSINMADNKLNLPDRTREQIKAEREAKKAAKAAAKAKTKNTKTDQNSVIKEPSVTNGKVPEIIAQTNKVDIQHTTKTLEENVAQSSNIIVKEDAVEGKSKSELRAERRAKQEAQRAAKQQQSLPKANTKDKDAKIESAVTTTSAVVKKTSANGNVHEINLFKHLYQERELSLFNVKKINSNIHPAILKLGVQYSRKIIVGSNARCIALLVTINQLIKDFEKPPHADFIRGLEATLQESIAYLHYCRPLAVSMQNALRHLKWQMTQFSSLSDEDAKDKLKSTIDTYILEQIKLADKAISITSQSKIFDGDIILTYGYSSLINKILVDAHAAGKKFRVIVVDGRPKLEGREQIKRLIQHGIECSYILINALSFIMSEVNKVIVGAHAILANGAVMSRVGTAQVALMAKARNVPVLVACETHKTCERVQIDSIVHNELGDADELVVNQTNSKKSLLSNWRNKKALNLLNITYDVTPADLVTAIITELGIVPCTSVPVILRIKPTEI